MKPVDYLNWGWWNGDKPLTQDLLDQLAKVVDGRHGDPLLELPTGNCGEKLILQEWPDVWDVWIYQEPSDHPYGGVNISGGCQADVGCRVIRAAAKAIIARHNAPPSLFPDWVD